MTRLLSGTFVEHETDVHVERRARALGESARLRELSPLLRLACWEELASAKSWSLAMEGLARTGIVLVQLAERASAIELLACARRLGEPVRETAPATQPYVECEGFVLNIVANHGMTQDVDLQPFGLSFLTLHTEGSGRSLKEQPKNILLSCCSDDSDDDASRTVVVPMESVAAQLSTADVEILSHTRYCGRPGCPSLYRVVAGRAVFSFRDFHISPLQWECSRPPGTDAEGVNACIRRLLAAMYEYPNVDSVCWRPGMFLIVDNTSVFHGRSASKSPTPLKRHLQRVRVVAARDS